MLCNQENQNFSCFTSIWKFSSVKSLSSISVSLFPLMLRSTTLGWNYKLRGKVRTELQIRDELLWGYKTEGGKQNLCSSLLQWSLELCLCRNRSTKQKKQVVSYQQLVMELDLIFIVHGMEGGKDRLFFFFYCRRQTWWCWRSCNFAVSLM